MNRTFRVVTHKNWIAAQFASRGAVHDFGFDIDPCTAGNTLWWAPGAWVASALKSGVRLPLLSCGPYWLGRLPYRFTGRKIHTMPLSAVPQNAEHDWPDQIFAKLPEAKVDSFPARLHSSRHLADHLAQYQLPPDTLVQIQTPVEFETEVRFWVAHGEITAHSFYRVRDACHGDTVWGSPEFEMFVSSAATVTHRNACLHRMRVTLGDLVADTPLPPGVVIDIGITKGGQVLVVEANAAWSSGPYDADPDGVFRAIEAAHDFANEHGEWAWRPDPALHKSGPLKITRNSLSGR